MNADEIFILRSIARDLYGQGRIYTARKLDAAAAEIERLQKIEAAAIAWSVSGTAQDATDAARNLVAAIKTEAMK